MKLATLPKQRGKRRRVKINFKRIGSDIVKVKGLIKGLFRKKPKSIYANPERESDSRII